MSSTSSPRVSVLIPNYNNGRESSVDGRTDLIGNLLESLTTTLHDDPTPFEIIAYDDGSTDDSLATLRDWSQRQWPGGQPFLHLIEAEHTGVLSKSANILSRQARGDILARLDGDVVCLTPHWVSKLCRVFDDGADRLGVVGPKQLGIDGRIIAYGDWVLHPCGYWHIAKDKPADAVKHPMQVDHVMGCFYCCRRRVFEELDGYDEQILRGQTVDLGLRALQAGWFCMAVPHIEYVHAHRLRRKRPTLADSDEGVRRTLDVFERKWGFNRLAPDLDEVRRRYAGAPLLRNARWRAQIEPANAGRTGGEISIASSDWQRYAGDELFRRRVDMQVSITLDVIRQLDVPRLLVQFGSGVGLIAHLLARHNLCCVGLEGDDAQVDLARQCVARQTYSADRPRFELLGGAADASFGDGEAEMVLIVEQLEHHPNPVALLKLARRLLAPGGNLLVISARRSSEPADPSDPTASWPTDVHYYRYQELLTQIKASAVGDWQMMVDADSDDPSLDVMVAVARRKTDTAGVVAGKAPAAPQGKVVSGAPEHGLAQAATPGGAG